MSRFLNGLNRDISDIVELHHYVQLEDLVHQAINEEQKLKRKRQIRKSTTIFNSTIWKINVKVEGASSSKEATVENKGKIVSTNPSQVVSTNKVVKCYKCQGLGHIVSQCPTRRTMLVEVVEEGYNEEFEGYEEL